MGAKGSTASSRGVVPDFSRRKKKAGERRRGWRTDPFSWMRGGCQINVESLSGKIVYVCVRHRILKENRNGLLDEERLCEVGHKAPISHC